MANDVLIQENVNPTDGEILNIFQTFSQLATMQHRQTGLDWQNWMHVCQWNLSPFFKMVHLLNLSIVSFCFLFSSILFCIYICHSICCSYLSNNYEFYLCLLEPVYKI